PGDEAVVGAAAVELRAADRVARRSVRPVDEVGLGARREEQQHDNRQDGRDQARECDLSRRWMVLEMKHLRHPFKHVLRLPVAVAAAQMRRSSDRQAASASARGIEMSCSAAAIEISSPATEAIGSAVTPDPSARSSTPSASPWLTAITIPPGPSPKRAVPPQHPPSSPTGARPPLLPTS